MEADIVRIKREHMDDPKFRVPQVYQVLKDEYAARGVVLNITVKTVERC